MIRYVGGVLIFGWGLWLGNGRAKVLERRVETLEDLMTALSLLGREITLHATPLPELFARLSQEAKGAAGRLFAHCAQGLQVPAEEGFSTVWKDGVGEIPNLQPEERRLLADLGPVLGRFPAEEQQKVVEGVCARLREAARFAGEECRRMGRVYRTLGAAFGGFLLILLL